MPALKIVSPWNGPWMNIRMIGNRPCRPLLPAAMDNSNAIADMALENYVEMRATVNDPKFHLKKAIAFELENRLPDYFIPRYSMVMFHLIPYAEAFARGKIQYRILDTLAEGIESADEVDHTRAERLVKQKLPPFGHQKTGLKPVFLKMNQPPGYLVAFFSTPMTSNNTTAPMVAVMMAPIRPPAMVMPSKPNT